MRFAFPLALCITIAASTWQLTFAAEHTKLSLAEIKQQVDATKGVLVDVREKQEWDAGHVDGAIFFPMSAVQDGLSSEELAKLPKDKTLYVHCVVGKRALAVGNILEKRGYAVRVVKPGYKELIAEGFPKAKE